MTATDLQRARGAPALSIRQPWAELIVRGDKDVELRRWTDAYRGPLWIHAGKTVDQVAASRFHVEPFFTGGLVAFAELTAIRPLTRELYEAWRARHRDFQTFPEGGDLYGWILKDVRRLDPPRPLRGALGLFPVASDMFSDADLRRILQHDPPDLKMDRGTGPDRGTS